LQEVSVENYRRRPPMEGFSRPGSLGGEAWDDEDSVEGHMMDDRTQDQDVEGHAVFKADQGAVLKADEDDTEGHAVFKADQGAVLKADEDDTEGHAVFKADEGAVLRADDDDTEGHAGWLKASDDDDTEGHAKLK
jgi:hypothetical protein